MPPDSPWETPDGFTHWPKYKRIEWHRKRVSRDERALRLLLGVDPDRTDEEIYAELEEVQAEIVEVEARIVWITSENVREFRRRITAEIVVAKSAVSQRLKILMKPGDPWSNGRSHKLPELRDKENAAVERARAVEEEMLAWGESRGIDLSPLVRTDKLEWRT